MCYVIRGDADKENFVDIFGDDGKVRFEIVGRAFTASYRGNCTINYGHVIKRGNLVSKIQRKDNPFMPVSGVACTECTRILQRSQ